MLTVDLALAGLGVGAIAALAAVGLITSYRATGVFNLGFGALAMVIAYLLWQQVRVWDWPVVPAALFDVLVVAPVFGLLLERFVFRGLGRRGAGPAEMLAASLGVLVMLLGVAILTWGTESRLDPPALFGGPPIDLWGDATVSRAAVIELGVVVGVALLVAAVTRFTRFGADLRAVVDQRELAELTGVPADRVAAVGWAFGSMLAGLTGILLAPHLRLDPFGLTLLVLEIIGVAVVARLTSLPVAILVAVAIGVGQSELTRVQLTGRAQNLLQALQSNLFVVVLLLALLLLPRMVEVGARGTSPWTDPGARGRLPALWWLPYPLLLAAPLALGTEHLQSAQQVPALAIVFVSLVIVTGYAGQVSLGQAGFAGLGALIAASLVSGQFFGLPETPGLLALPLAALLVIPLGLLTGWPAIRRRGLALALTTFAVAAVVSRFVFAQPIFTTGLRLDHPWPFDDERAFYVLELLCLGLVLLLVRRLHQGRLGRMLVATRDSEGGAAASGVDVPNLKVFVFAVSAGVAALGGALLGMAGRAFDAQVFDPIQGLIWFAAVVVFGVDSAAGAVLAAALIVGLDSGTRPGMSVIVVGAGAVLLSRMPGGALATARRLWDSRPPESAPRAPVRLTARGEAVRARVRSRRPAEAPTGDGAGLPDAPAGGVS
ncbi:ABC transporter permease [Yinghuangia seranimata]|uniref:ABC transporter permease n=1 Tax=Yinghuangia seranimata TaxID=408067 RepID=UPI00248CD2AB|nr:ABC transporter permease [Yinghuangia seranimata]MDI2126370.1 ABC transporter permease [Yinghuangia seranimata]